MNLDVIKRRIFITQSNRSSNKLSKNAFITHKRYQINPRYYNTDN